MPPAVVRRPLTVTVWLVMSVLCLALSPLLLALAAVVSALTRRPQTLIFARLVVTYCALELSTLIACAMLWLASGGGLLMGTPRFQRLHYRLLRWFVHGFARRCVELFDIQVPEEESTDASRALASDRPLLFFCRHAGPGDTVLVMDRLLTRFDRLPSVVFKQSVAFDPCVDLIAHRLPHAVLDTSRREECEARIEEVAAELGDRGVLVLFPEGGNFTPERRRRAIRKLWRVGRRREAARAQRMSHVLPPRPSGALAALRGNPEADVIFAAHSGLGLAAFPIEIWHEPPLGKTFHTRMWLSPAAERPADPDEQVAWIYDWWKRLDGWIEDQGSER
ncbi:MAG: 1-acyl-sn-glycerol-3-phosphate acyltransferase [Solirubrobacteraceae bacterium]